MQQPRAGSATLKALAGIATVGALAFAALCASAPSCAATRRDAASAAQPEAARLASRRTRAHTELVTPQFVLVTTQDEKRARALAARISALRVALESLLGVPIQPSAKTTLFALDGEDWRRFAEPRSGISGWFYAQPFSIDLVLDVSSGGRQALELTLHEYTHHLLRSLGSVRLPPFVDEGLAELLGSAAIGRNTLRFVPRPDHIDLLRRSAWLPFERVIGVQRFDPEYLDHAQARLFYAQAWASMFYVIASADGWERRLPAYLAALHRPGTLAEADLLEATEPFDTPARAAETLAAAEALVGHTATRVNDEISRFLLRPRTSAEVRVRLRPAGFETVSATARRLAPDEYDLRLAELMLRLGNRATLARSLLRGIPEVSPFAARARALAAIAVLQSGDTEFAAALLDEPAIEAGLDAAARVQIGRGLVQLSLPTRDGAAPEPALAARRLTRAQRLFAAALDAPCCWLEATHGHVLSMVAMRRADSELLERAMKAQTAAPRNPELAAAVAHVHEANGRTAEARRYWVIAARNAQGAARLRFLERLRASGNSNGMPIEADQGTQR